MLYYFKSKPQDFLVTELLTDNPNGEGDFLYIFFEQKSTNTMDLLDHLCKTFSLERKSIGIAGLKDKTGITQQRMSIHQDELTKCGGKEKFLTQFTSYATILETSAHHIPLHIGANSGNAFTIRLRAKGEVPPEKKQQLAAAIESAATTGAPNCFGIQRFGKGFRNFKRAKAIIEGKASKEEYRLRFMLQAYANMYFNEFVMEGCVISSETQCSREIPLPDKGISPFRSASVEMTQKELTPGSILMDAHNGTKARIGVYQDGKVHIFDYRKCKEKNTGASFCHPDFFTDIVPYDTSRQQTGPMLGSTLVLPPLGTPAYEQEMGFLEQQKILSHGTEIFDSYHIHGLRRPVHISLTDLTYHFEGDDCILQFTLPTGAYATVVLATILRSVDEMTCVQNRLLIPTMREV